MHKPHTNVETPRVWFAPFHWELRPYSFIAIAGSLTSGCSGLSAYLQYNEDKVKGCIEIPVYAGAVPPETEATEVNQDFCLPSSKGGIEPTP